MPKGVFEPERSPLKPRAPLPTKGSQKNGNFPPLSPTAQIPSHTSQEKIPKIQTPVYLPQNPPKSRKSDHGFSISPGELLDPRPNNTHDKKNQKNTTTRCAGGRKGSCSGDENYQEKSRGSRGLVGITRVCGGVGGRGNSVVFASLASSRPPARLTASSSPAGDEDLCGKRFVDRTGVGGPGQLITAERLGKRSAGRCRPIEGFCVQ